MIFAGQAMPVTKLVPLPQTLTLCPTFMDHALTPLTPLWGPAPVMRGGMALNVLWCVHHRCALRPMKELQTVSMSVRQTLVHAVVLTMIPRVTSLILTTPPVQFAWRAGGEKVAINLAIVKAMVPVTG